VSQAGLLRHHEHPHHGAGGQPGPAAGSPALPCAGLRVQLLSVDQTATAGWLWGSCCTLLQAGGGLRHYDVLPRLCKQRLVVLTAPPLRAMYWVGRTGAKATVGHARPAGCGCNVQPTPLHTDTADCQNEDCLMAASQSAHPQYDSNTCCVYSGPDVRAHALSDHGEPG
jgi:hypothetical protein